MQAACLLDDSSLIVLQGSRKSDLTLHEFPISSAQIGKGQELGRLRLERNKKTPVKYTISASRNQDQGMLSVVVSGADGNIEMVLKDYVELTHGRRSVRKKSFFKTVKWF
jgi:hypothetical protein